MIGLGYIGLPTATLFASRKIEVVGVDVLPHVVETINQGRIHIVEPELDMLVQATVTAGYLRATTAPEPADAFLVAVPTPFSDGFKPDLAYVHSAALSIAPVLKPGDLVILESTSPVGTTEQMAGWLAAARPDLTFPQQAGEDADVQVAHCPERVLPGHVVRELVENDRVIGGMSRRAAEMACDLYKLVVQGECLLTDARTAEMCKLAENSFRDTNIAFANELSIICGRLGVDVWELIALANRHPRVDILRPGPGVGGHCIAVDPWFIVDSAPEEARLIRTAREVNESKPAWVVRQAREAIDRVLAASPGRTVADVTVACLGLAFKPDIDDLRESPAVQITADIAALGCEVLAVEPHVETLPARLARPNIRASSLEEAADSADVLCVLVKHRDFVDASDRIAQHPTTIDTVGLLFSSHGRDR
jgi:UDP-N-acetyl-D-mannosaminuronic acid dehydrogenase